MTRFFALLLAVTAFVASSAAQNQKAATSASTPSAPLMTAPPASSPNETVVEEIIARVNNSIITRADLHREEERMMQELRQQNQTDANAIADRQKHLLRTLIDQQLLVQKGADMGITGDTEVIKRLDEMRKEMGASSMEELEKMAEQQGISFEDYKQNMKNSIITQQVIGREVGGRIQITHDDIQKFYDEHKAELDQPERIRLSEILVAAGQKTTAPKDKDAQPVLTEPTPEELAQAETKANEALAKIKAGAKFEDVAKQFSNGPTVDQGGDLGYFKRGTLSKELEDQTFQMKAGETTGVVRTKQGFIILKVTEHVDAGVPPLKKVEDQIREAIYFQKVDPAVRAYLTKLREEAYINVKQGFVDTGASPNQTNMVYTYADTDKKKTAAKKKKKHFLLF